MIADMFDVFFFDLDGVVYIGGRATPGAASTLDRLRGMGKAIRFLTNNPTTRSEIADRLRWHGIEAEIGEIITAGSATADYLAGDRDRGHARRPHQRLFAPSPEKGSADESHRPDEADELRV